MNRELKFRAFCTKLKVMSKPFSFGNILNFADVIYNSLDLKKHIVMQFTGLKDKNDADIYEGDILQEDNGSISFVIWFRTGYALQSPGSESIDIEYSSYYSKVRIIGNIHSNPELLK